MSNLKKLKEKAKYVRKNKRLKVKLKDFTAYMATNTANTQAEAENDEESDNEDEDDMLHDAESKTKKKKSKDTEDFFKESDDDESSSSSSSSSSECKINDTKGHDANNNKTNAKKSKSLFKQCKRLQMAANDFKLRYCGHCNVATDIKEANFLGEYVFENFI